MSRTSDKHFGKGNEVLELKFDVNKLKGIEGVDISFAEASFPWKDLSGNLWGSLEDFINWKFFSFIIYQGEDGMWFEIGPEIIWIGVKKYL
jgi:hypothetical protein